MIPSRDLAGTARHGRTQDDRKLSYAAWAHHRLHAGHVQQQRSSRRCCGSCFQVHDGGKGTGPATWRPVRLASDAMGDHERLHLKAVMIHCEHRSIVIFETWCDRRRAHEYAGNSGFADGVAEKLFPTLGAPLWVRSRTHRMDLRSTFVAAMPSPQEDN